jgi:hypothetical protein
MKKFYFAIICLFFLSCKKEIPVSTDLVDKFINCDITGDYNLYFEQLSLSYKNLLYSKYKTKNDRIVFDSLKNYNYDLHLQIEKGKFTMTNTVMNIIPTEIKGLSIVKYRSTLFDHENKSELFKEKILLKITDSILTKFVPYSNNYTKNIDSLITSIYNNTTLNKLKSALKFKKFNTNNPTLNKIDEKFKNYIISLKANNNELFDFLYPPIMNELLKQSNETSFTPELKTMLLNNFKQSMKTQTLDFHDFFIEDIEELVCNGSESRYLLSYVIDVKKNVYIPGQAVVFIESNKIYFIEYDKTEFEATLSEVFEPTFIECVDKQSEKVRKKLGLN